MEENLFFLHIIETLRIQKSPIKKLHLEENENVVPRKLLLSESREERSLPKLPLQTIVDFAQPVQLNSILHRFNKIAFFCNICKNLVKNIFVDLHCTTFKTKVKGLRSDVKLVLKLMLMKLIPVSFQMSDNNFPSET